ncbi:MAG: TRAP transporter small permease [Candidatus Binatia bacterium]
MDASFWKRPRKVYVWCDQNLERLLMLWSYSLCSAIICVEAVRRYLFRSQAPWTPMAAIYLFVWLTWIACAYNVKARTHLRFDALRKKLPYHLQFALQLVDHAIWLFLGVIITLYGVEQMRIQRQIGALVQGTDNFPLWIPFMGVPLGWILVLWRVTQNVREDIRRFHKRESFLDAPNPAEGG